MLTSTQKTPNDFSFELIKAIFYCLVFFSSYILFYHQIKDGYPTDLKAHVGFIHNIVNGKPNVAHFLFHYIVYGFSKITGLNLFVSAVFINASLVTMLAYIVYKLMDSMLSKQVSRYLILFLVFIILYSGTPYLLGLELTKFQYLGNGSIGIWHNVTLYMVKPFAFISFFLLFGALKQKAELKLLIISFVCALISIFAKPSFIVIFMPMLGVLTLYCYLTRWYFKQVFFYSLLLGGLSVLCLLYQYAVVYTDNANSSVIFAPLVVWRMYSDNLLVSFILANLFLVVFLLLSFKQITLVSWFSILLLAIGVVIFALFAESGPNIGAANFSWSYIIAQQIVYLSLLIDFVNNHLSMKRFSRRVLFFALSLQFVSGLYYYQLIYAGHSYY